MDLEALYEEDVETWAEVQVDALRRLAATSGPWANTIDWQNVIEEIEDLGSDQRRAVERLLQNALAHAIKIAADPHSLSAEHWRREITIFLDQAQAAMRPAIKSRIDLDKIWRKAGKQASNALDAFDRPVPDLPPQCPCSLDQLMEGGLEALLYLGILGKSGTRQR